MVRQLTKTAKATAEKSRISRLTNLHEECFKIIFSHQIESGYDFTVLNGAAGSARNALTLFKALGKFIDDTKLLSITEVEDKYKRLTDVADGTHDPETDSIVQIEHFALFPKDATPTTLIDSVRLHGYFRTNRGYFVLTKLDWFHEVHNK